MKRRQAKKILRNCATHGRWDSYTPDQIRMAENVRWSDWHRSRRGGLTPGWRWGHWDPSTSIPPWEMPF